jgi:hypothetical protein
MKNAFRLGRRRRRNNNNTSQSRLGTIGGGPHREFQPILKMHFFHQ